MFAITPVGSIITGSSDSLLATAEIDQDSFEIDPKDGALLLEYAGESDVHWDTQEPTKDARGATLYSDEGGDDWPEDAITLIDATDFDNLESILSRFRTARTRRAAKDGHTLTFSEWCGKKHGSRPARAPIAPSPAPDVWAEVPGHPVASWQYEVANNDTRLGYADWIAARIEQ